jgi:hypothetical protein
MTLIDLTGWMDENTGQHIIWYIKRLSANDTLANGSHQAGPYIPREFLFDVFPSINQPEKENPDKRFDLYIDSHSENKRQVRAIWYNNKLRGRTRNETRLTNFGGSKSALLHPDSTGSLTVFAFHKDVAGEASVCRIWLCATEGEADLVEDRIGPIEPGKWKIWTVDRLENDLLAPARTSCWLEPNEMPPIWLKKFPSGAEIILKTVELRPAKGVAVDTRLMKRRDCEYEIFRSVEQALELPLIKKGFETVDDFIARAQTILQRRKARSGRSLELHAREIFIEEKLHENIDFQHQPESDPGKRPDFLFPNEAAYKNKAFSSDNLRMLAVKTTCKDRWRQIINEADRIPRKHLLTLQEGVSENQFREMKDANVCLIVPQPLVSSYPPSVRPYLQTLEEFINDIRLLNSSTK